MQSKGFGDVTRQGKLILFPTTILCAEHPARTAQVLASAEFVGLPSIYLSIKEIPPNVSKTGIIWKLKGICERLNARFSVVSSRKGRMLVYVSFSNPILKLPNPSASGGGLNGSSQASSTSSGAEHSLELETGNVE